jgi:hypothetical protein
VNQLLGSCKLNVIEVMPQAFNIFSNLRTISSSFLHLTSNTLRCSDGRNFAPDCNFLPFQFHSYDPVSDKSILPKLIMQDKFRKISTNINCIYAVHSKRQRVRSYVRKLKNELLENWSTLESFSRIGARWRITFSAWTSWPNTQSLSIKVFNLLNAGHHFRSCLKIVWTKVKNISI